MANTKRLIISGFSANDFNNNQFLDVYNDSMFIATFRGNGMVGIRDQNPTYPLDVIGDINTTGALRVNGSAGSEGQVLRSNGNGTMGWADVSQYKNFEVFRYTTTGAVQNWIVPAGVTRIKTEAWGGGGYGTHIFLLTGETSGAGGGGGGYITGYINVTPGETIQVTVGNGGVSGTPGGQSQILVTGPDRLLTAFGGTNGTYNSAQTRFELGMGGGFSVGSTITTYFGLQGQPGSATKTIFEQRAATEFIRKLEYGNGGNAGNTINTGGIGGFDMGIVSPASNLLRTTGSTGLLPGGGGASVGPGGSGGGGAAGMVIIYY